MNSHLLNYFNQDQDLRDLNLIEKDSYDASDEQKSKRVYPVKFRQHCTLVGKLDLLEIHTCNIGLSMSMQIIWDKYLV